MLEFIVGTVVVLVFIIAVHGAWLIVKDKEREYWDRKEYEKMKRDIENDH